MDEDGYYYDRLHGAHPVQIVAHGPSRDDYAFEINLNDIRWVSYCYF